MCRSIADGGQRCASHTREALASANNMHRIGSPEWTEAAVDYASTTEGQNYFARRAKEARAEGEIEQEVEFRQVAQRGRTQREVNDEARMRILAAQNPGSPMYRGQPTRLVGDTAALHDDDNIHRVFRPFDRRSNSLRFVEDPDGTVWSVNKHGVVLNTRPDPVLAGWNVVDFAPVEKQTALKRMVRDVDPTFKRCSCC